VMDTDCGQWTTLGALPEFGGASRRVDDSFTRATVPPGLQSPGDPDVIIQTAIARGVNVDIGACVSRAWEFYKSDFGGIFGPVLLAFLIMAVVQVPFEIIPGAGSVIGSILGMIVGGPMTGGLWLYLIHKKRGQPVQLGDIFNGFRLAFLPLLLLSVVSGILVVLGIFCCIIPGIYLAIAWTFAIPLIMDKRLDFWQAMEVSRKVVTRNWFMVLLIAIVASILAALGVIACCIGVIFTLPLQMLIMMFAYEDIFGAQQG